MVQESYKDFHGIRGRHVYDWDRETLIDWWLSHFTMDESTGYWVNTVPFCGEDEDVFYNIIDEEMEDRLEAMGLYHD